MLFFFNDTATTEIYTLSLHDALPISAQPLERLRQLLRGRVREAAGQADVADARPDHEGVADGGLRDAAAADGEVERRLGARSEEHTSELQSRQYLVCRLLLEKKKEIK